MVNYTAVDRQLHRAGTVRHDSSVTTKAEQLQRATAEAERQKQLDRDWQARKAIEDSQK